MQVERRVNLFTMPRRRRFKPRIDCVAILGKLSSRLVTRAASYIYNPPQTPPLKRRGLLLPCGQPCLRRRCKRQKGLKGQKGCRGHRVGGLDEIRMGKLWVDKGFERVQRV